MRLLPLLLLLFLSTSCNQNMLGAGTALKNFVTSPFRAVKSIFTDRAYKDEEKKMKDAQSSKDPEDDEDVQYCLDANGTPTLDSHIKDLSAVLKKSCQCKAWGSCVKEVCSCTKLCPDNFNIFKRPPFKNTQEMTDPENGFAFRDGADLGTIKGTQGYCWGFARTNAQFNRLGFFHPDKKPPYNLSSSDPDEQSKAIDFYKGIIDKISSNKTADIPGFKNLREFSSHPALQSYLSDTIAKSWAENAMTFQGLSVALGASRLKKNVYKDLFTNVKKKLSYSVQPTIVFTRTDSPFYTHAVLVSHMEQKPGVGEVMCIRDSNSLDMFNHDCQNYMRLTENGLKVEPYAGDVGDIRIAHNDNPDMISQKESLLKKCRGDKNCKN